MPPRCICDRSPDSHVYHGKKKSGTLTTHHGVVHTDPRCPHSDLRKTTRKYKRKKVKHIRGTRRLVLVDDEEPKRKRRRPK